MNPHSSFASLNGIAHDVRYALRTLRKSPGYALTAVLVLALAIGATTTMFSVLDAVLLRPLPYQSPEQLALLWTEVPSQNLREGRTSFWNFEQWRNQSTSFVDMAVSDGLTLTLTATDKAEQVSGARISPNFFKLLGVQPLLGRIFTPEEAEQRQRVALVSHRFWQSRFSGSQNAIGASIELNGVPSRIIGVVPASFRFTDADVWEPHTLFPDWPTRRSPTGSSEWMVVARLRAGVSFRQAQAEMSSIAQRLNVSLPISSRNQAISVSPFSLYFTTPNSRFGLYVLAAAVFFVLLIAAANVAGLSLARNARRSGEMSVRAALGASRGRIVRQLFAESLVLAAMAGGLGLLVAWTGIRGIVALKANELPRLNEASLDPRAVSVGLAICVFTGILMSLGPAVNAWRTGLRPSGHEGSRVIAGGVSTRRTRRALVVAEFALSIVLLAGAGLLIRSLHLVEKVDPGFRPERVLSVQVATPASLPANGRENFYRRVVEEVQSLPGVEKASVIGDLFIGGNAEQNITVEGASDVASSRLRLRRDEISEGFFETMRTPLRKGRFFSASDGPTTQRVAIINEEMSRRLWAGQDPVGRRFALGDGNGTSFTVVGVAADMRRQGLEIEAIPQMFEPVAQNPSRLATLLVRTAMDDPMSMLGPVETAVRRVEKHAPLYGVTTLEQRLGRFLVQRRFQASLMIGFSAVALLMAAIGIYGLIQFSIATRTHEIGIRMAAGAQAGAIFRMILTEGLRLSLSGLAIGLLGSLLLGRAASNLLFGVTPYDPVTLTAVSLLLTATAAAACYFPARRAMKMDPTVALRQY